MGGGLFVGVTGVRCMADTVRPGEGSVWKLDFTAAAVRRWNLGWGREGMLLIDICRIIESLLLGRRHGPGNESLTGLSHSNERRSRTFGPVVIQKRVQNGNMLITECPTERLRWFNYVKSE